MTNAIVWKVQKTDEIWAVADSRITTTSETPRRVTDQAMKVLKLEVGAHGKTTYSHAAGPVVRYHVGMVYAGAVLPALMTHATASMMLANLHPQLDGPKIRLPLFSDVGELIRQLSEQYIKDAAWAYPKDNPPLCELVIFAQPPTEALDQGPTECYWIHPKRRSSANEPFELVAEFVDLDKGEMAVIGIDGEILRQEIADIDVTSNPGWKGVEPRIALGKRIQAQTHDTVGGSLQFGILGSGGLQLYGASSDTSGNPVQNWLGFDCQDHIREILKMPVVIPALL